MWFTAAVLSAFFAGLTSVLAKCGIKKTDSDVATALRTIIVLLFSWLMTVLAGSVGTIKNIDAKSLTFLILSGLATGVSWLCYFKALSMGDVNKVVPIDKSSTVLTVLLAIVILGETKHLAAKLTGTAMLAAGIFLMLERRESKGGEVGSKATGSKTAGKEEAGSKAVQNNAAGSREARNRVWSGGWILYAVLSAIFAALTSILAKVGIANVESNLATAVRRSEERRVRTGVVLIMAWLIVFVKGKQRGIRNTDKKELLFIGFSGLATGASWLCYYYAIQNGIVSVVVPIDKLSIIVTVIFSRVLFGEKLTRKGLAGLGLMIAGTLVIAVGT